MNAELQAPASLRRQLAACLRALRAQDDGLPCTLFVSLGRPQARARVVHFRAGNLRQAWRLARVALAPRLEERGLWLRLERSTEVRRLSWSAFERALARSKRNYFRWGVAFDEEWRFALLEQELNANAILVGGAQAAFNSGQLRRYARQRFAAEAELDGLLARPSRQVWLFRCRGVFCGDDGRLQPLQDAGSGYGLRACDSRDPQAIGAVIADAAAYLAGQVRADGRYAYGWFPCFDRPIGHYNALRHASSTYALLEAWQCLGHAPLRRSAEAALAHMCATMVGHYPGGLAFLREADGELKLGGGALCLLALAKHAEVTGERHHLPLMRALAAGILHMRDDAGGWRHVLQAADLSLKQRFRIIYYEGEATFALLRLYRLSGEQCWLDAASQAMDGFIERQAWRHHDHWLSYCANELTRYRPEPRYFRFALDNLRGYLDFVERRLTTFPTLLELMMSSEALLRRIAADPERAELLEGFDTQGFYRALQVRAGRLLDGVFRPELAMFMANPARIVGSCFIRHHAFRVRIDDVEHYLSGLIAYRDYLRQGAPRIDVMGQGASADPAPALLAVDGCVGASATAAMLGHALARYAELRPESATAVPALLEAGAGTASVALVMSLGRTLLEDHRQLQFLARRRAMRFHDMPASGRVVLDRDMPYYAQLRAAAEARGLRCHTFGEHTEAEARLLRHQAIGTGACAQLLFDGRLWHLRLAGRERRLALQALAAWQTLLSAGLDAGTALAALDGYGPPPGAGRCLSLPTAGGRYWLLEHTAASSPTCLHSALRTLAACPGRRLAILGSMHGLGDCAEMAHAELAGPLRDAGLDLLLLCGEEMRVLHQRYLGPQPTLWFDDAETLAQALLSERWLTGGDWLLAAGAGLAPLLESLGQLNGRSRQQMARA